MRLTLVLLPLAAALCSSTHILASSDQSQVYRGPNTYTPSVPISKAQEWTSFPGASWVWESASWSTGLITFVDTFVLPEWKRYSTSTLTLYICADDNFSVTLNGKIIAPGGSGDFTIVTKYDLKLSFIGTTALSGVQVNTLEISVYNSLGPGGLLYKVEIAN